VATIRSTSPADDALLGEVPVADCAEIARRAQSALEAFRVWRETPVAVRVERLRVLRRLLAREHRRIAEVVAREQGKPVVEATVTEVFPALDALTFLIHRGPRALRERRVPHLQPFLAGRRATIRLRPYGVWAVIAPWNYPFSIPFCQIATLLFGGNTAVLKPSPLTPLVGEVVVDLFRRAGFDAAVIEIVHGGAEVGESLVLDESVRAVVFTGGPDAGRRVMELAARAPKKVVLELGGKDPAIVRADADLERSARGIAWSAMLNAGQTCASVERVYVDHAARDRFVDLLVRETAAIRVGDPFDDGTDVGPLASAAQLERVVALVDDARTAGAAIRCGGRARADKGRLFYAPTVIVDPPAGCRLAREEIFGPVVAVEGVAGDEIALARANDCAFGLTASIWTRDAAAARRLARRLDCGVVTVNTHLTSFGEANSIWGGTKCSGFGRTHGEHGLLETLETQYLDEERGRRPEIWWYPYTPRFRAMIEEFCTLVGDPSLRVRAAAAMRFVPWLGYLARHTRVLRMGPGLLRYLR